MADLVEFLRARLHEDEQAARETLGRQPLDQWDAVGAAGEDDPSLSYWRVTRIAHADPTPAARSIARHIARWDPARVLAEVETKRRIVDLYSKVARYDDVDASYEHATGRAVGLGEAVRLLATAYAEHPDYDPKWAVVEVSG